jgi:hypothetical protein
MKHLRTTSAGGPWLNPPPPKPPRPPPKPPRPKQQAVSLWLFIERICFYLHVRLHVRHRVHLHDHQILLFPFFCIIIITFKEKGCV